MFLVCFFSISCITFFLIGPFFFFLSPSLSYPEACPHLVFSQLFSRPPSLDFGFFLIKQEEKTYIGISNNIVI